MSKGSDVSSPERKRRRSKSKEIVEDVPKKKNRRSRSKEIVDEPSKRIRRSRSNEVDETTTKRSRRSRSNEVDETSTKRSRRSRSNEIIVESSKKKSRRSRKESPDQYPRYYGEERENSDSYWNKYPKKDTTKVGQRYYADPKEKSPEPTRKTREKEKEVESEAKPRERKQIDMLTTRTGGAYIPPAKLRMMQENITDKSSAAYQRIAWEALKKSIHGYINKINTSNIGIIARELLHENIVRGRGLLCKSIIQAQAASPTFTNVYAALVAIINSKFPNIGELLLKRLVLQFKRGFKQNNKAICISAVTFVAHLVNQRVAHEILALEILTLLVESPSDDSVEVAISFLKECGQKLSEVSSKGNPSFTYRKNTDKAPQCSLFPFKFFPKNFCAVCF